jgi:hypothetical protein
MATRASTRKITPEPEVIEGEVVTATDTAVTTDECAIGPLKVRMQRATEDQMAVLAKVARAAEKDPQGKGLRAVEVFFRLVENLLVDRDDIERLEDALADRKVTLHQIAAQIKGEESANADKAPRPRTRRGR